MNLRKIAFDYVKSEFIEKDIDIILLQEVQNLQKNQSDLFDYLDEKGYRIFYSDHSLNGHWNIAILVKKSLINESYGKTVDKVTGKYSSTRWMCYEFILPHNQKMTIINIYANPADVPGIFRSKNTKHGYDKFREELEEKVNGDGFVIVAGDLNIDLRYRLTTSAFPYLNSILINCIKDPIWTRFPWQDDHILINQKLQFELKGKIEYKVCNCLDAEEMVRKYSDHIPLEVIIDFD